VDKDGVDMTLRTAGAVTFKTILKEIGRLMKMQ
jgi:hypothetical protein